MTSPTGAAIRDFLQVLARRWKNIEIMILPVKVQGQGSGDEIARAVSSVSNFSVLPDVVVVTRGGGSKEDLWSFSEEAVCRAVYACPVPVISAVGHEIDVSLSDLVADVRALTPSEAAERLVPDQAELSVQLENVRTRMTRALTDRIERLEAELQQIRHRPVFARPMVMVENRAEQIEDLKARLNREINRRVQLAESHVEAAAGRLEAISPLAVLSRGYSLTSHTGDRDGQLVTDASQLEIGSVLKTRLANGTVESSVTKIEPMED